MPSPLLSLGHDVIGNIYSFLDTEEQLEGRLVCKAFNKAISKKRQENFTIPRHVKKSLAIRKKEIDDFLYIKVNTVNTIFIRIFEKKDQIFKETHSPIILVLDVCCTFFLSVVKNIALFIHSLARIVFQLTKYPSNKKRSIEKIALDIKIIAFHILSTFCDLITLPLFFVYYNLCVLIHVSKYIYKKFRQQTMSSFEEICAQFSAQFVFQLKHELLLYLKIFKEIYKKESILLESLASNGKYIYDSYSTPLSRNHSSYTVSYDQPFFTKGSIGKNALSLHAKESKTLKEISKELHFTDNNSSIPISTFFLKNTVLIQNRDKKNFLLCKVNGKFAKISLINYLNFSKKNIHNYNLNNAIKIDYLNYKDNRENIALTVSSIFYSEISKVDSFLIKNYLRNNYQLMQKSKVR